MPSPIRSLRCLTKKKKDIIGYVYVYMCTRTYTHMYIHMACRDYIGPYRDHWASGPSGRPKDQCRQSLACRPCPKTVRGPLYSGFP